MLKRMQYTLNHIHVIFCRFLRFFLFVLVVGIRKPIENRQKVKTKYTKHTQYTYANRCKIEDFENYD